MSGKNYMLELVRNVLEEDLGSGDLTSAADYSCGNAR